MFSDIPSPTDVLHREAAFRLKVIADFRILDAKLREQEKRIDELSEELGRRNGYVHELHLEREQTQKEHTALLAERDTYIHFLHLEKEGRNQEVAQARADVEYLSFQLDELLRKSDRAEQELNWYRRSFAGLIGRMERLLHPLRKPASPSFLPGDAFRYHLVPSPFRIFRTETFTLCGWAMREDGRGIQHVRARIGEVSFAADSLPAGSKDQDGLDVPLGAGAFVFKLELRIPAGRSYLQLEAQADGSNEWRSILNAPLWRIQ